MPMGEPLEAVTLAPIAIEPVYQRRGIDTALIQAGHAAAIEKGYPLRFLLGQVILVLTTP
jgi:predicted N-acetyltransferase YhbS